MEAKYYLYLRLADAIPGLATFLAAAPAIGSLMVFMQYKVNAYVMIESARSGMVTTTDHLTPFHVA